VLLCSVLVYDVASAKTHPSNCTPNCSHQYNSSMRAESSLHVTTMQACGIIQIFCKGTETIRHAAAVKSIQAGRDACNNQCPGPGRGTGGR